MALEEQPIYSVALSNISELMENISEHMAEQEKFRDEMGDSLKSQLKLNQENQKIVMEQMRFIASTQMKADKIHNEQLKKSGALWKNIKSNANDTYKIVRDIAKFGIGAGLGGIGLGLAGAYGYGRMAANTGNQRRESMEYGSGMSIGHMLAFKNAMPKVFANPLDFLSKGQEFRQNPIESHKLKNLTDRAGISTSDFATLPIADLLIKSLVKAKEIADSFSEEQANTMMRSPGLLAAEGLGIFEDRPDAINVLRELKKKEITEIPPNFDKEKLSANVTDAAAQRLQELDIQFEKTITEITSTFKEQLSSVAVPLKELTKLFGDYVKKIAGSKDTYDALEYAMQGLTKVVDKIASRDVQNDVNYLFAQLKELGETIYKINHPFETAGKSVAGAVYGVFGDSLYQAGSAATGYFNSPAQSSMMNNAVNAIIKGTSANRQGQLRDTGEMGRFGVLPSTLLKYHPELAESYNKMGISDFSKLSETQAESVMAFIHAHEKELDDAGYKDTMEALSQGGFATNPTEANLRNILIRKGNRSNRMIDTITEEFRKINKETKFDKFIDTTQSELEKDINERKERDKLIREKVSEYNIDKFAGPAANIGLGFGNKLNEYSKYSMNSLSNKAGLIDNAFGLSENWKYLSGGYRDAVKDGGNMNWGGIGNSFSSGFSDYLNNSGNALEQSFGFKSHFKWINDTVDDVINSEKAKKMGDFIRDGKDSKSSDKVSYNFSPRDVKRIELGVKVGSRPGGDIFGQVAAMS
jgi:hypothetical protein